MKEHRKDPGSTPAKRYGCEPSSHSDSLMAGKVGHSLCCTVRSLHEAAFDFWELLKETEEKVTPANHQGSRGDPRGDPWLETQTLEVQNIYNIIDRMYFLHKLHILCKSIE